MKNTTRESWLLEAIKLITPHFESVGYKVPKNIRVTCGWPSTRALGKRRAVGQCWSAESSKENMFNIFISPFLAADGSGEPVDTLVHEVVHAVVGLHEKHNKVFKKCALAVGLEGKMTSASAGEELLKKIAKWEKTLGAYPHDVLDQTKSPVKKQTTRMIKMECGDCGYVCRTAKKWLDLCGPVECPEHGAMEVS